MQISPTNEHGLPLPHFESEGLEDSQCQHDKGAADEADANCFFMTFVHQLAKLQNNADVAKRFWKINAVRPINKGNSRKIEESPQSSTTQIEADCGTS